MKKTFAAWITEQDGETAARLDRIRSDALKSQRISLGDAWVAFFAPNIRIWTALAAIWFVLAALHFATNKRETRITETLVAPVSIESLVNLPPNEAAYALDHNS